MKVLSCEPCCPYFVRKLFTPLTFLGDACNEEIKEQRAKSPSNPNQESFYIVSNYDLIRVRYLLVYAKRSASIRFSTVNVNRQISKISALYIHISIIQLI